MPADTRQRLIQLVRRPDADLAEAALLVCAEVEPHLDVDVALLRIDALADILRSDGFARRPVAAGVDQLVGGLAGRLGFHGDQRDYHDPDNSLLTRVLDRRRGLPLTLSVLYTAVGRRLGLATFPIALPGHVVTGITDGDHTIVIDPFHGGVRLDEPALVARIEAVTGGRYRYHRAMLRPASAVTVTRRMLSNLTRDLTTAGRHTDARVASELRLLLPNRLPEDHRDHGEVLLRLGRFDAAADAFEAYLDAADPTVGDREEVRRAAIGARARLN